VNKISWNGALKLVTCRFQETNLAYGARIAYAGLLLPLQWGSEVLWWPCPSACLSVCFLSANISISGITTPIFRKFLCVLPMAVARSSSAGVAIRYVLPVLWMTSYLHIMGHIQGCRCNTDTASQPDGAARRLINFLGPIHRIRFACDSLDGGVRKKTASGCRQPNSLTRWQ